MGFQLPTSTELVSRISDINSISLQLSGVGSIVFTSAPWAPNGGGLGWVYLEDRASQGVHVTRPFIGVITNITPVHGDFWPFIGGY